MFIAISDYDLCDGTLEGGFAATDLRLRFTRAIEVVNVLPTSAAEALDPIGPVTYDRGTRTLDLSFTVSRNHTSIRAAELFIGNHENAVPQSGSVKLTTQGGTLAFIANGFLVSLQLVQQIGSTTFHSYRIVGGLLTISTGGGGIPRPNTLNQVIATGITIGLWPVIGVPTPTTLNEVIDAGTTLGLWPSGPVPDTPTTLNEVIAAGTALDLWD